MPDQGGCTQRDKYSSAIENNRVVGLASDADKQRVLLTLEVSSRGKCNAAALGPHAAFRLPGPPVDPLDKSILKYCSAPNFVLLSQ